MITTPKLPPAAAFRHMSDMLDWMAHPEADRRTVLDQYMMAMAERGPLLEKMRVDTAEAAEKLEGAQILYDEAQTKTETSIREAQEKANDIVKTANRQAEQINATVAGKVAAATEAAESDTAKLLDREMRVNNDLNDREVSVSAREAAVGALEMAAQDVATKAEEEVAKMKTEYEGLMKDISAIQRRAG